MILYILWIVKKSSHFYNSVIIITLFKNYIPYIKYDFAWPIFQNPKQACEQDDTISKHQEKPHIILVIKK